METKRRLVFDPGSAEAAERRLVHAAIEYQAANRPVPPIYVYSDSLRLHVEIALATERPLLLRGPPGCGKSTVAEDIAVVLHWDYYEQVITSRMEARDLLWRFDAVSRLGHAHGPEGARPHADYVVPGPLWCAFDAESARDAGAEMLRRTPTHVVVTGRLEGAVVLLDEIDKADPDFPNDLLVPLGAKQFRVAETGELVRAKRPTLVVITTNEERDLPPAFLRRCIVHVLQKPGNERLKEIVTAHYGKVDTALLDAILQRFEEVSGEASSQFLREPGTAELLDAVRVCLQLGINPESEEWKTVTRATMWKHASLETGK